MIPALAGEAAHVLARSYFTTADMSGLDEYDYLIYPGFMRRPMARWNEDGSVAPMARARGPKGRLSSSRSSNRRLTKTSRT